MSLLKAISYACVSLLVVMLVAPFNKLLPVFLCPCGNTETVGEL